MKAYLYLAAVAAASLSEPASAQLFTPLPFFGYVTGVKDLLNCGSAASCDALIGTGVPFSEFGVPFEAAISGDFGGAVIGDGQSVLLTQGSPSGVSAIFYSGTVTNNGGVLTGTNLNYFTNTCPEGSFSAPCTTIRATAPTFVVRAGVPEPSTWAMMLLGFGAIGMAFRTKRRSKQQLATA